MTEKECLLTSFYPFTTNNYHCIHQRLLLNQKTLKLQAGIEESILLIGFL